MRQALSHNSWDGLVSFLESPYGPIRKDRWEETTKALTAYYAYSACFMQLDTKTRGQKAPFESFESPRNAERTREAKKAKATADRSKSAIDAAFLSMVKKKD